MDQIGQSGLDDSTDALVDAVNLDLVDVDAQNVVTGRGEVVGAALAAHMDVDVISLTGDTETGKRILSRSWVSPIGWIPYCTDIWIAG
jgi:acyl-CoA reductase-like NAD-dependent aldehyde dehydrogenase